MKNIYTLFLLLLIPLSSCFAKKYNIIDFGATNDSSVVCTDAIQATINTAAQHGGGTIVIPKGTFLTGALYFKKGTSLYLKKGAKLKGSDDISHYPLLPSRMEGQNLDYYSALINADSVNNFRISGEGIIDGNGLNFWKAFHKRRDSLEKLDQEWTNLEVHRPRLIFIQHSNNINISEVELINSGFWTTHLYKCDTILIEKAKITSPLKPISAPSTDGIDLDACCNVTIRDCYISVNDDAIALKGGKGPWANQKEENGAVENILIENCTFGPSFGCITLGSECIHGNNITIRNCILQAEATPLLYLKLRPDTPQRYENILIENINGYCDELIKTLPWTQFYDLKDKSTPPPSIVTNIKFNNLNIDCNTIGVIQGNESDTIKNISFENSQLNCNGSNLLENDYLDNISFNNVWVNGKLFTQQQ